MYFDSTLHYLIAIIINTKKCIQKLRNGRYCSKNEYANLKCKAHWVAPEEVELLSKSNKVIHRSLPYHLNPPEFPDVEKWINEHKNKYQLYF